MHQKNKEIQKRFEGFTNTPCLWKGNSVFNIEQFKLESKNLKFEAEINEKLRLGKYIERFVSYQLENEETVSIVAENIQIQKENITLGELDCILKKDNKNIHLEIVYKFYLFDVSVGNNEIEHFIGPNRKDSLIEKLTKLKEKQLPLLYSKECESYLKTYNLSSSKLEQQVYFKAQLFVPFSQQNTELKTLNSECIVGFYINNKELKQFKDCKFYIPNKKDWLVNPHQNINWLNFINFKELAKEYMAREFSPLCWIKFNNGEIKKFFLTWW